MILSNDDILVVFLVNEDGNECIQTKETIIEKSKDSKILNIEEIRKEIVDGKEHIFIDLDEQVTENVV